jgi:hypothetical protein
MKRSYKETDFHENKKEEGLDIHKIFSIKKMIFLKYIINDYYKINEIFPNEIIIFIGIIMSHLKHKIPIREKYYIGITPFYIDIEDFNELKNIISYGFGLVYDITSKSLHLTKKREYYIFELTNKVNKKKELEIKLQKNIIDKNIIYLTYYKDLYDDLIDDDYHNNRDEPFYLFLLVFSKKIYYRTKQWSNKFTIIDVSSSI